MVHRRDCGTWKSYGVVAAAATGLLRGPLRFRPLRGPAAPPYTSLDLARSTRLKDPDDRPRCEQASETEGEISFQKRIDVRLASDVASRCLLPRARRACLDSHNGGRR